MADPQSIEFRYESMRSVAVASGGSHSAEFIELLMIGSSFAEVPRQLLKMILDLDEAWDLREHLNWIIDEHPLFREYPREPLPEGRGVIRRDRG